MQHISLAQTVHLALSRRLVAASFAVLALSACSGGGGSETASPPPPPPPPPPAPPLTSPAGHWEGTTSDGRTLRGVVFGDGEVLFFQSDAGQPTQWSAFLRGTGTVRVGGNLAVPVFKLFGGTGTVQTYNLSVTFVERLSMSGSLQAATGGTTFTARHLTEPVPGATASTVLSRVAGSYGRAAPITITTGGTFTGVTSLGCSYSGTLSLDPAALAFRVSGTWGGAPCRAANEPFTGVLFRDEATRSIYLGINNAQDQFYFLITTGPLGV